MSTAMRALLQTKQANSVDSPDGDSSTIQLGETTVPNVPLPGFVVISVHAASLSSVDIERTVVPLPHGCVTIVGYDVAGVIIALAPDVSDRLVVGDSVFGTAQTDLMGEKVVGSIAEFAHCRADLVTKIPDGVSFIDAAALPLVGQTALQALRAVNMCAGERILITCGSDGVGIHAMQIAKRIFAAREIATTASESHVSLVKKYGADIIVEDDGKYLCNWADVALDCGYETNLLAHMCKDIGRAISIMPSREPVIKTLLLKPNHEDMCCVARLVLEKKLYAVVDSVFDLDNAMKAVERLESGQAMGKVVIQVRSD